MCDARVMEGAGFAVFFTTSMKVSIFRRIQLTGELATSMLSSQKVNATLFFLVRFRILAHCIQNAWIE